MAKSWRQKLEDSKASKLQTLEKPMAGAAAGDRLLLPTPKAVKAFMDAIPASQQVSFAEMRRQLAQTHQGDVACPITTSMAARTVAEAAWEDIQDGKDPSEVTPFWRVIEPGSSIAGKLACGSGFVAAMREKEGLKDSGKTN
jgi:hypothetical protein